MPSNLEKCLVEVKNLSNPHLDPLLTGARLLRQLLRAIPDKPRSYYRSLLKDLITPTESIPHIFAILDDLGTETEDFVTTATGAILVDPWEYNNFAANKVKELRDQDVIPKLGENKVKAIRKIPNLDEWVSVLTPLVSENVQLTVDQIYSRVWTDGHRPVQGEQAAISYAMRKMGWRRRRKLIDDRLVTVYIRQEEK